MKIISPWSIEIKSTDGVGYKSISNIKWGNIPPLAIITGKNGAGKTQLLEAMSFKLTGTRPNHNDINVSLKQENSTYTEEEIVFIPSSGYFSGNAIVSVANLQQKKNELVDLVRNVHSSTHEINQRIRTLRAARRLSSSDVVVADYNSVDSILGEDYSFLLDDTDISSGMPNVIIAYQIRVLEAINRNTPGVDRNGKPLGQAPWDVVNEAFRVANFPYRLEKPTGSILQNYRLLFKDIIDGREIFAPDLSSGEKVIVQLVFWLYAFSVEGSFPRLLLLDEPDAHMHPSMTLEFIEVVQKVLVEKYGMRVIMTTHSPSTVALAPEGSIFQMERGGTTVDEVTNRADVISLLTAGLVTVSKATRFFFAEDEDDVDFYNTIRDILTDYGPSRDPKSIKPTPTLVFVAASVGAGSGKQSGGASIVSKWIAKLDTDPVNRTFFGIIDKDIDNTPTNRLFVIKRYSLENYLLDPLNIFTLLNIAGTAPPIQGFDISAGDEHLLRLQPTQIIQAIATKITSLMESVDNDLKSDSSICIKYTSGQSINMPSWIANKRGHDLLIIAQKAFGGAKKISPNLLLMSIRRGRMIPEDLADTFHLMQG